MAHTLSAKKRMRQNSKSKTRNKSIKSLLNTKLKKFHEALAAGNIEEARERMRDAEKHFRRAADTGPVPRNAASRHISRMAKQLVELEKQGA